MKDKLIKSGHRKPYYRFLLSLKVFSFCILLAGACSIPIAITMQNARHPVAAEEGASSEPIAVEEDSSSEEVSEYPEGENL